MITSTRTIKASVPIVIADLYWHFNQIRKYVSNNIANRKDVNRHAQKKQKNQHRLKHYLSIEGGNDGDDDDEDNDNNGINYHNRNNDDIKLIVTTIKIIEYLPWFNL